MGIVLIFKIKYIITGTFKTLIYSKLNNCFIPTNEYWYLYNMLSLILYYSINGYFGVEIHSLVWWYNLTIVVSAGRLELYIT